MPEKADDACVPQAVTDFIFDLYDSVTLSQISEEQDKLYSTTLPDFNQKYFSSTAWPSATSIASECNGDPLFLAVYRELTHRHWHSVSRPSLADRIEGWDVYRELFDEILESNFYLLPSWVFDILNEFVYQYQGFAQLRSSVFSSARKQGLLDAEFNPTNLDISNKQLALSENLLVLLNNKDAWDVEAVYTILNKLVTSGLKENVQPVLTYFGLFASITLSRLECLLGDYMGCLMALDTIHEHRNLMIAKDENLTVEQVSNSVVGARVSLAYHAGIAYLQLRRYKDASKILCDCAASLQRGFKSGSIRNDQLSKQYDRILSLLAILQLVCPDNTLDETITRIVNDKHSSKIQASSSLEDWFQSPKFISADASSGNVHHQQVEIFNSEMKANSSNKAIRSYLKLYKSLPVQKLANFHDKPVEDFVPLLLSYKARMFQTERSESDTYSGGEDKSALDIHYYINNDTVNVDEAEKQRRFETYFASQIAQSTDIRREAEKIDTTV